MTMGEDITDPFESQFKPTDDAPYRCVECGDPLTYGGRGRKPKYCADHKPGSGKSTGKQTASMTSLEQSLTQMYVMLGMALMIKDGWEDDAKNVMNNADRMAHSWIVYAEANPKVKKMLLNSSNSAGLAGVLIAHATVAGAIVKNHPPVRKLKS